MNWPTFLVPAKPALIAGWTGPALADAGGVLESVTVAHGRRYGDDGLRLADDLPVMVDTMRPEVRDLLARRMSSHRWIATAEMNGAVDAHVVAALWWCAAHASLTDIAFRSAHLRWRNVGSAGQKPNTSQWMRESLEHVGPPVQLFNVPTRKEVPQLAHADARLLDEHYALVDTDTMRLPMPWGVVTIERWSAR